MRENSRQNTKEKKMFTDLEKKWKAIVLFLGIALLVSHANGGDDIKTFTRDHLTDLAVKSANNWYPKDKNVKLKFTLTDISSQGAMGEEHIRFKGNLVLPENCYSHAPAEETLLIPVHWPELRHICVCFHKTATRVSRFLSVGSCKRPHAPCSIELSLRFLLV